MEQLDLSSFFRTKAQANEFLNHLAALSEKIYETNFNLEDVLMTEFGIQQKDAFMAILQSNAINIHAPAALKEFLAKLQETVTAIPVLSLTVAFEPTDKTLRAISEWFVTNTKRQFLLEVVVDQAVIAGAIITANGKYKDYSVKQQFQKLLISVLSEQEHASDQKNQPVINPVQQSSNAQLSPAH